MQHKGPRRSIAKQAEGPANTGRPPIPYDPVIGALVLIEMAKGEKALIDICRDNGWPDRSVIYRWVLENRDFAALYSDAREIQQHSFADSIISIADTDINVAMARNRIDARKWMASRLLPRVYGDHINHEHTGYVQSGNAELIQKLTPEERDIVRGILLAAAAREAKDEAIEGQAKRIG